MRTLLFGSTIARHDGKCWLLLNHTDRGYNTYALFFDSLQAITQKFHVILGEPAVDDLGLYVNVYALDTQGRILP